MEYDENDAIKAIRNELSEQSNNLYNDDELLNVIDMIWDYYEENGLLDIDIDEENDGDEDIIFSELCDYVCRMLKKDKEAKVQKEDVPTIIRAEIEYEQSIDDIF